MSWTSSRLLTLLSLMQGRRDWPGNELAERLEVSTRTIRRDIERLRELGYPVQSLTGPAGGYRLRAGTAMPPLLLDDDEAVAIAIGLRTAARASVSGIEETSVRALVKLEQVLPAHLRRRVSALGSATIAAPVGGPTVDPQQLTVIAAACRDTECLRFAYRSREGAETRRLVEPHALVNLGRRWYLVAWDQTRRDWRTFRIDRLTGPAATGVRFVPRPLPARDPAAYVERSIAAAPNRFEARVTVHASAEEVVRAVPFHWGTITPIDAHSCEYRTGDDELRRLALRIAMLGFDFELHEPTELSQHLQALSERLSRGTSPGRPGHLAPPPRLFLNTGCLPPLRDGHTPITMAGGTPVEPCAAHNCLKPRWKDGWCATHWYGHSARMMLHAAPAPEPDSLAICQAIWDASPPDEY